MSRTRDGEQAGHPFRSQRLFQADGGWWYDVRDGHPAGPFRSKPDAEVAMACYVAGRIVVEGAVHNFIAKRRPESSLDAMIEEAIEFEQKAGADGLTRALCWLQVRIGDVKDTPLDFTHSAHRMNMLRHLESQIEWPELKTDTPRNCNRDRDLWDEFASEDDWNLAID